MVALCVVCLTSCVVGFAPYVGFAFDPCVVGFTPCGWTTSGWASGAEGVAVIPCGWVATPCRHQECCVRLRFVVFTGPGADVNQTARPLCSCARRRRREAVAEKRCRPSHCYSKTLATRFLRLPPLLKKVRIGTEVAHARNHPHQNREHHESESQSRGIPLDGPPKGLPKVYPGRNHRGHPTDTPKDTARASTGG